MRISDWSSDVFSSVLVVQRAGAAAGRLPPAGVVRARRGPAAGVLRGDLGAGVDVGAEGPGRRGDGRPVRVPDVRAERRGRRDPPEGDAGDPADAGGGRPLADSSEEHTSELKSLMRIS